ncbi:amidohydrolase family protein [Frankia sp. CNm7]|uniref:Amidohydrolase family protein n=1 Tax=Frankia nepalensis TaxID=1836974 RepID=A0A937UR68_9ACTN|nr:amidohydrolase family protein [Frankia nepalensis]MBL7495200.1 amidohydrolase family protein [Frankia nepalensis]MBL7515266.1 amidohydrolase family protein [Frankia nepalensis]MBL7519771.1 amidohydrolase family protein [Frankia nepalensis]MBL7628950.1 amidohydrolase family protein [Frankia nepalensis]
MDLLLRNATLIDGTGGPARPADVAVAGDRIAAVGAPGELTPTADTEVVDLGGLVLAPGFVDVHTHYDAQILWDGDLTPSSWHGVTSVVMGNCGFGVAPTRPEHRDLIVRLLENVEGMSMEALNAGIDWCFETFPEYLAALDARSKRLNVGAFIGHSPLRLFVTGGEERPATEDELATMRALVREALDAGAIGFSTSRQPAHSGAYGRPVPSRFAEVDEVYQLAEVLGEAGKGVLAVSIGPGLFVDQFSEIATRYGIPVTWTALVTRAEKPGSALRTVERGAKLPGEVYPQIACRPIVMQTTMDDPTPLAAVDEWKEVLALPRERRGDLYRDASWRDRARPATLEAWNHRWHKIDVEETETHGDLVGIPLDRLASERGTTPFDLMLDLALSDTGTTRFRVVLENDGDSELADLLADRRTLLGLSDAGAHASQLCDACYSTHLLGHWVRERKALSLEEAVWKLTGQPRQAFRLAERGLVQPGFYADLVVFDPDTVGTTAVERVHDQPSGADRLVVRSTGVEHTWVNGVATRFAGEDLPDATPGRLLRA